MPLLLGAGAIGLLARPLPVLTAALVAFVVDHWF
jgi:hypothetical protein